MAKKHSIGREQHQPPRTSAKPSPVCLSREILPAQERRKHVAWATGCTCSVQNTKLFCFLLPRTCLTDRGFDNAERRERRGLLRKSTSQLSTALQRSLTDAHARTYEEPCTFEKFEHTVCLNRKGTVAWHGDQSLSMAAKSVTHGPTKPSSPMICATYSREGVDLNHPSGQ